MSDRSHGDEARRALASFISKYEHIPEGADITRLKFFLGNVVLCNLPLVLAALRAQPERAAEEMRELFLAVREAEPTIMLTTISGGPAVDLIIDDREDAIRLYEALEAAVALPLSPAGEGE